MSDYKLTPSEIANFLINDVMPILKETKKSIDDLDKDNILIGLTLFKSKVITKKELRDIIRKELLMSKL